MLTHSLADIQSQIFSVGLHFLRVEFLFLFFTSVSVDYSNLGNI